MRQTIARSIAFALVLTAGACGSSSEPASPPITAPSAGAPASGAAAPPATSAGPAAASEPQGAVSTAPASSETQTIPGETQARPGEAPVTPAGTQATGGGTQAPAVNSPVAAAGSMSVRTKAVEVKVEGVTTASQIGSRQARPGHEFVIVDTSWKNVIPLTAVDKSGGGGPVGGLTGFGTSKRPPPDPKNITMESTPFIVPMLQKQIWLFTDERFADTVDLEAQAATPDALRDGFTVPKLDAVVRGTLVFEAPAGARYRVFQFYDNNHGHAMIPIGGGKPAGAAPAVGPARQNDLMQLVLSEAGFSKTGSPPAGQRYYTVGVRGVSRSPRDIVDLQPHQFFFLQNERGCVSQPERSAPGLTRPMGDTGSLPPTSANEAQLSFLVPEDTKQVRLLILPTRGGHITLPAGADFAPSWPAPQQTIQDGSTMKVHVLPTPRRPATLPAAAAGREFVVLDVVAESLKPNQGIDFQGTMQLRLMDPSGAFIQPSPLSNQLACTLGDEGVIPAGHARRFMYVYDVPAGMPLKLQYRGFEKDEVVVDIKR